MTLEEAMKQRHSVRSYLDKPLSEQDKSELKNMIEEINRESGLHIQLVCEEPKAFDSFMAHYGKFSGVKNYIAMIGKKSADLEEKCGYYGEQLVLKAQQMGLNTCWVAMTFKKVKTAFVINQGEKLCVVIAIGYGVTQGMTHPTKTFEEVTEVNGETPQWFKEGVEYALSAPTAMNQQKFKIILNDEEVSFTSGAGFYTKLDLGIVKYHFELGSNKKMKV